MSRAETLVQGPGSLHPVPQDRGQGEAVVATRCEFRDSRSPVSPTPASPTAWHPGHTTRAQGFPAPKAWRSGDEPASLLGPFLSGSLTLEEKAMGGHWEVQKGQPRRARDSGPEGAGCRDSAGLGAPVLSADMG